MTQDDPEKLGNESAYEDATDMIRRVRRGDESKGDADERDVAGDYADDSPEIKTDLYVSAKYHSRSPCSG